MNMATLTALRNGAGNWRAAQAQLPKLLRRVRRFFARREVQATILCLSCCVLGFAAILPQRARLDSARSELASAQRSQSHITQQAAGPGPLDVFYAGLPLEATFPDALDLLFKLVAAHQVSATDGEYRVTREAAGRLVRFQIKLPLRATYPQVRRLLVALKHEAPGLLVENVRFERRGIGEPVLDVTVQMVLFAAGTP